MKTKLRKVSPEDILGIFKFTIALIPALFYKIYLKIKEKSIWLICETKNTARDNGYVFYQYMKNNHSEVSTYYAISKKCNDYQKVKNLGNIIEWGSLKHYFYYLIANYNISSHKEGNPNHSLFTVLHLYLHLFNHRVFLQHGILCHHHMMFHQKNTQFEFFITGAKPEYEFIKNKYGYQNNEVKYTGLARFDNLWNTIPDKDIILYMPTWRRYLNTKDKMLNSMYYKRIMSFLHNEELKQLLNQYHKKLYFCPHGGEALNYFEIKDSNIKMIDINSADIQDLLKKSSLLITDFSSIHTDFAFMKKPILYYQYDENDFLEKHIGVCAKDTYFEFNRDGFGKVINEEKELIKNIESIIKNDYYLEKKYEERIDKFFELHDNHNCERIYQLLSKK